MLCMEQFAYLQLKKSDLLDLHQALVARWMIENRLRFTQGLESIGPPFLVDRIASILNMNEDEAHALFHRAEDELWEYSWHVYTEEWAWHRAEQDVRKQLKRYVRTLNQEQLNTIIEKRFETAFERYVAEVAMEDEVKPQIKRTVKNGKK